MEYDNLEFLQKNKDLRNPLVSTDLLSCKLEILALRAVKFKF